MTRARAFDNERFFAALDAARMSRGLNWKTVADESGVSPSTLTRIRQGRRPDIDSFAALTAWAALDANAFFARALDANAERQPLAQISLLLRRDPSLPPEAATALDELVKATYVRLRR